MTTTESRLKPFDLMVALNETGRASGDLYWDDGDSIDTYEQSLYNRVQFEAAANTVRSNVLFWNYKNPKESGDTLGDVTILGVKGQDVIAVTVNGLSFSTFTYNPNKKVLLIRGLGLPLKDPFLISYN